MHGFLNINKPAGITSRAAVDLVKRACSDFGREADQASDAGSKQPFKRFPKIGHTGTLDPIASGVLVICIGDTTRLAEFVQQMPKSYRATFLLDRRSETDDTDRGFELLETQTDVTKANLKELLGDFVGDIDQIPPKYSAAKVSGRRAYKLARQNKDFALESRTIKIYSIDLIRFEYPEIEIDVCCGAGTYVRSLGRDIAARLGTSAVMCSLIRKSVGDFTVDCAIDVNSLDTQTVSENLFPPITALTQLLKIELSDEEIAELRFGRSIQNRGMNIPTDALVSGVNSQGELVALLKTSASTHEFRPHRNFNFV